MTNFCPNCGSRAQAEDQFCVECGAPLKSSSTIELKPASPATSFLHTYPSPTLVWLGGGLVAVGLVAATIVFFLPGRDTGDGQHQRSAEHSLAEAAHNPSILLRDRKGIERDEEAAAQLVYRALRAGDVQVAEQLTNKARHWNASFTRSLQQLMKQDGAYDGIIDGEIGPGMKQAIRALAQKSKSKSQ